ncbi:MAG: tRNA preQ1(34) S-adenosylmethionine ribosyltransferase-isomerase QueA [Bdellovibrionota bacterium]
MSEDIPTIGMRTLTPLVCSKVHLKDVAMTVDEQELNVGSDITSLPYDYLLPTERIAERPCYPFHAAKMLSITRSDHQLRHRQFTDLADMLGEGDVLVLNNTQVLKARLFGMLQASGAACELLLTEDLGSGRFQAMGKPLRKMKPGIVLEFGGGMTAEVIDRRGGYFVELQFHAENPQDVYALGVMPIPPYIREGRGDVQDESDYQTPYARFAGSVAAPTAGLHFTQELLTALQGKGVHIVEVTLHVGPASFLSVWETPEEVAAHVSSETAATFIPPGCERGHLSSDTAEELLRLKQGGKRVIAVGTTVVRLLETAFPASGAVEIGDFNTELFIQPGYEFSFVDAVITNFHQPRSSHLLLVESFLGRSLLGKAYEAALDNDYRFLSYGDGMFIE